ncbi:MAG: hypothetical protein ACT443_08230 [Gemmatimonadota bacterium]
MLETACAEIAGSKDEHLVATLPGTWRGSALGGSLEFVFTQSGIVDVGERATVSGSGSYTASGGNPIAFAVTGELGPLPGKNEKNRSSVLLIWRMPYGTRSSRDFRLQGGLQEENRMQGFVNSPGTDTPGSPDRSIEESVTFTKS